MSNRRNIKRLLLNPRYQLKFVLLAGGSSLLLAAANAAVFYHFVHENYVILVDLSPMTEEVKAQLHAELLQIVYVLCGLSALFSALVGGLALWISHQTAGPLYHFQRVFQEISEGKPLTRIRLRPRDDFREVADSFNELMDQVQAAGQAKIQVNDTVIGQKNSAKSGNSEAA